MYIQLSLPVVEIAEIDVTAVFLLLTHAFSFGRTGVLLSTPEGILNFY